MKNERILAIFMILKQVLPGRVLTYKRQVYICSYYNKIKINIMIEFKERY